MKSCIYQILNLVNDKFYIGHAIDYDSRWWEHARKLRTGKHDNKHLQNSYDKYGVDAFEYILIELVEEKDMLAREQFWIDSLGACDILLGYNINPDASRPPSPKGRIKSEETRRRISIATTGIPKAPHTRPPFTDEHKKNIGMAARSRSDWPCEDGYNCGCDICRPRRNRMKNYPHIYGNPSSPFYRK